MTPPQKRGREKRKTRGLTPVFFFLYSEHGHDKSTEIRKYSSLPADQRPTMFYAGDGVSDLSAAKETDLLFAKTGMGE